MLETNIDDSSGEVLGYVMEKVSTIALDAFYTSIYMKKNRPAYTLSVLCYEEDNKEIESIIFRHTTSIGIRKYKVERDILERQIHSVQIEGILAKAKVVRFGAEEYVYPEYESAKELADTLDIPIKWAYEKIQAVFEESSKGR